MMKKSIITLHPKHLSLKKGFYGEIINVGLPSLFRQGLASIATILLNNQAGAIAGDPALSGMSIVSKVFMILFSIALGIGQGYQPVCGYNYSSHNYKRVKEAMLFTFFSCTVVMSLMGLIFFIFSDQVVYLFMGEDVEEVDMVIKIGGTALRYQCLAMPFMGVNLVSNMTYQSARKKFLATLLAACRQGIFLIPSLLILPNFLNIQGVQMAQPLSDVLTCLFTLPFFLYFLNHLTKMDNEIKTKEELKESV